MTDELAFIRTIITDPYDDAPRLGYSDWLEEHDQIDRAKFIRLSIEEYILDRVPGKWNASRYDVVYARLRDIWQRCGEGWFGHLPTVRETVWRGDSNPNGTLDRGYFLRGFLMHIATPLEHFLGRAEDIFRQHPIERVTFLDRTPERNVFNGWKGFGIARTLSDLTERHLLPTSLYSEFDLVCKWKGNPANDEEANIKLSQAAVNYGRKLAGLPPIDHFS